MEAEQQERQRQALILQQLQEQRDRDLQARLHEEQRQRQAEIQRQLALELENINDDVDEFQPPEANAQVRNVMYNQWRAEHERELDPDLHDFDFDDFDDFDVDDWQRLDDVIAQAFPLNEQQDQEAADIYEVNRRFENEQRRDMQNHQDDVPDVPQRDPRDLPRARRPYVDLQPNEIHSLGPMNVICAHCNALHWDCEKLSASTARNPKFGSCCLQGQIQPPPLGEPPRVLKEMLCGISPYSKPLRQNILNTMLHLHSLL